MSIRSKQKLGAIGMTTVVSGLAAVAAWALVQIYSSVDTRITNVEAQTATINNTVISDHQDIQWIRQALQDNRITPK